MMRQLPRPDVRPAQTAGLANLRIVLRYALADVGRQLLNRTGVAFLPPGDRWNGKRGTIDKVRADTIDGYQCRLAVGRRRRWLSPELILLLEES